MTGPAVDLAFWVFAAAAVWFGWRVFRTDSMVRASFSLLVSFLNAAAIMILLLAEYLGVALFFMMALEMTVMALFMVAFMMNPAGLNPMSMVHRPRIAAGLGAAGALAVAAVAILGEFPARPVHDVSGSIVALGKELLGNSMLVFESAGVTLLAAMIGSVILTARSSRYGTPADEGSHPPPLDPEDPDSVPDLEPPENGDGGHGGHHGGGGQGSHHGGGHEEGHG